MVMAAIGTGHTLIHAMSSMMMISLPQKIARHAEVLEFATTLKMPLTPGAMVAIGMKLIQLADATMVSTIGNSSLPMKIAALASIIGMLLFPSTKTKLATTLTPIIALMNMMTTATGMLRVTTTNTADGTMMTTSTLMYTAAPAVVALRPTTEHATGTLMIMPLTRVMMAVNGMTYTQLPAETMTTVTSLPQTCAALAVVDTDKDNAKTLPVGLTI